MASDIGPRIGIQGEAQFRKELQNINTGLKTLGSEMKLVTSEFLNNKNSIEALTKKNDVLGRTVLSLNERLEKQKEMLAASAREYGEADERTQKWQQVVNATQTEINKYSAEIENNNTLLKNNGKTAAEVAKEQEEAAEKAKAAHEKWANAIKAVGAALAALTAAAASAAAAVGKMVIDSGYWADDLNTMAKTTGLSTEELQKFQYASDMIDVSVDTLAGSMTKLTSNMYSAKDGGGAAAEAFAELGISVTDSSGELRDRNEVFSEAIKALGAMSNETERDAVAMKIFGKSAQELNPLIMGGADALAELGAEAEAAGLILSQDDLDALNLVSDAVDRFKATTEAAGHLFSVEFAAPISEGIELITGYIQQLTGAFASGGWDAVADTFGGVLEDLIAKIDEYLPQIVRFGAGIVEKLVSGIIKMLPDIVKTGVEIVTTLTEGLADALPELIPAAVEAVLTITETLLDNLDQVIDAAVEIIIALAEGIIDALPRLLEKAPVIVEKLVAAIINNVPKLLKAAAEIIIKLAEGLVQNFPKLVEKGLEIVSTLIDGIGQWYSMLINTGAEIITRVGEGIASAIGAAAQWGKDLIQNFISGITGMWDSLKGAVSNVAGTIKSLLGFSEPDEGPLSNFHTYAPDMMKLYAKGITDNAWRVRDALDGVTAGMQAQISAPELSMTDAIGGMQTAISGLGNSFSASALSDAISGALYGAGVYMYGKRVGDLITNYQRGQSRAYG